MRKVLLVALAVSLTACADRISNTNSSRLIGAAVGGAVGGFLGWQFGAGLGQILATAAGAGIGAGAGFVVGPRLIASDQAVYEKTARQALASSPDGKIISWRNAETGSSGIFRPTRSFVVDSSGFYCRDYRATVAVKEGMVRGTGTACQTASGEWMLFDRQRG
jgi:surface antigen